MRHKLPDDLPKDRDNVLGHASGGYQGVYWYSKENNMFYEAWGDRKFKPDEFDYWMPIPEIPK